MVDAHCHLGWFEDPLAAAREAEALGIEVFAVTVTPEELERLSPLLADAPNVRLAAGLHPWFAGDVDKACAYAAHSRWVGEVGLDFSPRRTADRGAEAQVKAFERVCSAAQEGAVLSIHSVRAADAVLDVLERTGAASRCRCVFHWFSGSSQELVRAMRAGCWFSLGERSLATKRGREYAKVVPRNRLLTETDYPPHEGYAGTAAEVAASLGGAARGIAAARRCDADEVLGLVERNYRSLVA